MEPNGKKRKSSGQARTIGGLDAQTERKGASSG